MGSHSAHKMLDKYCYMLGIKGASTHSFRRTALTMMCNAGIPFSVIQDISDHASLDVLSRYLGVSEEQKKGSISVITFYYCIDTVNTKHSNRLAGVAFSFFWVFFTRSQIYRIDICITNAKDY